MHPNQPTNCGHRPGVLRHKQSWSWPGGGETIDAMTTTSHSLGQHRQHTIHLWTPKKKVYLCVFHVFGGFLLHIFAYEILVYGLPPLLELLEKDVQANTKCLISIMPSWVVNCLIFIFHQDQQDSNLNAHGHLALHHLASAQKHLFSQSMPYHLWSKKNISEATNNFPIPPLPQGTWAWRTRQKRTFWRNRYIYIYIYYIYISATIFWPCLRFWYSSEIVKNCHVWLVFMRIFCIQKLGNPCLFWFVNNNTIIIIIIIEHGRPLAAHWS